jgi:hypothetical protein
MLKPGVLKVGVRSLEGAQHYVSVTDWIRNCELPEDGAVLAPKHVGATIIFKYMYLLMHFVGFNLF